MSLKGIAENTIDMFVFCILKQAGLFLLWGIFKLTEMWIFTGNTLRNVSMFSNFWTVSTSRNLISAESNYTKTTKYTLYNIYIYSKFFLFSLLYMLNGYHNAVYINNVLVNKQKLYSFQN